MNEIIVTPGFPFKKLVSKESARLAFSNGRDSHIFSTVEMQGGFYYIIADAETTAGIVPGRYDYQLQDDEGIIEKGRLTVVKNLAISDENSEVAKLEAALKQCDDLIYGRAVSANNTVTIGDKSISFASLTELIKLRDYLAARLAKAKEEQGETAFDKNDQHKIIFSWMTR